MMEELRARGKACEGERATSSTDGPACAEMYGYQQLMRDVAAAGSGADLYRVVALHQKFGQQKQQAVAAGGGGGVNNAGAAVAPPHSREQAAPPELVAKARQAFAKMDYDHDGYIDTGGKGAGGRAGGGNASDGWPRAQASAEIQRRSVKHSDC